MTKLKLVFIFVAILCSKMIFSQETAPLKTFKFTIGVDHLKTQEQVNVISEKVTKIKGINNVNFILVDYKLIFECTNYDMNKYLVIDAVKQIITEEGVNLTTINRQTIK